MIRNVQVYTVTMMHYILLNTTICWFMRGKIKVKTNTINSWYYSIYKYASVYAVTMMYYILLDITICWFMHGMIKVKTNTINSWYYICHQVSSVLYSKYSTVVKKYSLVISIWFA